MPLCMNPENPFVLYLSLLAVGVVENPFPHRFTVHPSVLVSFFSSVFGLVASALLMSFSAASRLTLTPFCRMTLKSYAGPSFPNVFADPTS